MNDKSISVTFGRMNPPHSGHMKLINAVKEHAAQNKHDHMIFLSHTHDSKENPLSLSQKIGFLKKMSPTTNVYEGSDVKSPIDMMKHLNKKGYDKVHVFVGDDRVQEFHNLLHKYNNTKEYSVPNLEVHSRGADSGSTGMRGSLMRAHAKNRNFAEFSKGVPNRVDAKELYHATRKGMRLENYQCIFLVGAPGSGKDFLLRTVLAETGAIEIPLDKLYTNIKGQTNIPEMKNNSPLIINGNADNDDSVVICKKVLETMDYKTSMVYVYTSNDYSKARNDVRIQKGEKTITEAMRVYKYDKSVDNLSQYEEQFGEGFFFFDNSNDFVMVNEEIQIEIQTWLVKLAEDIEQYFNEEIKCSCGKSKRSKETCKLHGSEEYIEYSDEKEKALKKLSNTPKTMEGLYSLLKKEDKDLDALFEEFIEEDVSSGTVISNLNTDNVRKTKTLKIPQRSLLRQKMKKHYSGLATPSSYYDSKFGSVPSGGLGFSSVESVIRKGKVIK